jgi:membrane protein
MWTTLKAAVSGWFYHKSARLGAALAYYSVFSLGPLLLIVTAVAGLLFGADAARESLTTQFRNLLGETGSQALEAMLKGAQSPTAGGWSAVVGIALLCVAALGVVIQLRDALNTIFEAEEPKNAGLAWYARVYATAFAGILALGFLLAVSLVVSAGLAAFSTWIGVSAGESTFLAALDFVVSLAVLTLLFSMLLKWLPAKVLAWREVWLGGFVTALLFEIGKFAIAWYVGRQGIESTYGVAASIVVLLIWVYYSAQILLFGAEVTKAHAQTARTDHQ